MKMWCNMCKLRAKTFNWFLCFLFDFSETIKYILNMQAWNSKFIVLTTELYKNIEKKMLWTDFSFYKTKILETWNIWIKLGMRIFVSQILRYLHVVPPQVFHLALKHPNLLVSSCIYFFFDWNIPSSALFAYTYTLQKFLPCMPFEICIGTFT